MSEASPKKLFTTKAGKFVSLSGDLSDTAEESGLTAATPQQIEEHNLKEKYSGFSEQLKSGAEGFGQALTLGGSTYLETALGVSPEDIKNRGKYADTSHAIGTGLGIVAPLILTGGAAAPLEAGVLGAAKVGAKFTAPSIISRLGGAVAHGVEAALPAGEGLVGKLAAKAASMGAGSAVEAGSYELGQMVHEDALGDPGLKAEQVASRLGEAMLMGGLVGGALGTLEVGIPAAIIRSRDAIAGFAKKTEGVVEIGAKKLAEARGGEGDAAAILLGRKEEAAAMDVLAPGSIAELSKSKPNMASWALDNSREFSEFSKAYPEAVKGLLKTSTETADKLVGNGSWRRVFTDPEAREAWGRDTADSMQQVIDSTQSVLKRMNVEVAPAEAGVFLKDVDPAPVKAAYDSLFDRIGQTISKMTADENAGIHALGDVSRLKAIQKRMIGRADESFDVQKVYDDFGETRSELGKRSAKLKKTLGDAPSETIKELDDLYHAIGDTLKNPEVFGPQAANKAAQDEVIHLWKTLTDQKSSFRKNFLEVGPKGQLLVKSTGVNTWINQMGKLRGAMKYSEPWGEVMDAAKKIAQVAEDSNKTALIRDFDPRALARLVDKSGEGTRRLQEAAGPSRLLKDLTDKTGLRSNSVPGITGETRVKEMLAEHLGNTLAERIPFLGPVLRMAKGATKIEATVNTLVALEKIGKQVSDAIERGVSMLVRGGQRAEHVLRSEASAGVSMVFGKSPEDSEKFYHKKTEEIRRLASNPEAMQDKLESSTHGWSDHAPNTSQALQIVQSRKVAFLASKLPEVKQAPLAPAAKPSRSEMAKFHQLYEAVQNPEVILKQAAAGTLTKDVADAVRQTSPKYFQQVQNSLINKLLTRPKDIPYANITMMALILCQDLDGTLNPGMLSRNQQAISGPSNKPSTQTPGPQVRPSAKGASALTLSNRFETPMQSANNRR